MANPDKHRPRRHLTSNLALMKTTYRQSLDVSGAERARKVVIAKDHAAVVKTLVLVLKDASVRMKGTVAKGAMAGTWGYQSRRTARMKLSSWTILQLEVRSCQSSQFRMEAPARSGRGDAQELKQFRRPLATPGITNLTGAHHVHACTSCSRVLVISTKSLYISGRTISLQ